MTGLKKNFGCGVAIGSGHGSQSLILRLEGFRDSKVGKDEVGIFIGGAIEKVLRLEV
jgi:hypothetical protein